MAEASVRAWQRVEATQKKNCGPEVTWEVAKVETVSNFNHSPVLGSCQQCLKSGWREIQQPGQPDRWGQTMVADEIGETGEKLSDQRGWATTASTSMIDDFSVASPMAPVKSKTELGRLLEAHISGSTFGKDNKVNREEEEQQEGGQVGQHSVWEARREAGDQKRRLSHIEQLANLGDTVFHRRVVSHSGDSQNWREDIWIVGDESFWGILGKEGKVGRFTCRSQYSGFDVEQLQESTATVTVGQPLMDNLGICHRVECGLAQYCAERPV